MHKINIYFKAEMPENLSPAPSPFTSPSMFPAPLTGSQVSPPPSLEQHTAGCLGLHEQCLRVDRGWLLSGGLAQALAAEQDPGPMPKSSLPSTFVNKVLWHKATHLFTYCLWLRSCCNTSQLVVTVNMWPAKPKIFAIWSLIEKFADFYKGVSLRGAIFD